MTRVILVGLVGVLLTPVFVEGGEAPDEVENLWSPERKGPGSPAVNMTWHAAMAFCRWHSDRSGDTILLPTEAQWECAVRAAGPAEGEVYPWGLGEEATAALPRNANMDETGINSPSVVGAFPGGRVSLGKHSIDDMIGNVWEWCLDGRREYGEESVRDPRGSMEAGSYELVIARSNTVRCWAR